MLHPRSIFVLAATTTLAGCYTAEVDPDLEATYVCEVDSDCVEGQMCLLSVCTDGSTPLGPAPELLGPELLQVFPAGSDAMFPIVVGGQGLQLQEPGGANADAQGHIEVQVDGEIVEVLTSGDLEARVQTQAIAVPAEPGFHRVMAIARQNDGSVYPNAQAIAVGAFWVDDGQEHVGILSPAPGAEVVIEQSEQLEIEVAALNFDLVNPGFVDTAMLEAPGQGHVHIFFNREIPGCLPECNFDYESSAFPLDGDSTTRLEVEGGIVGASSAGTFPLQIVAQNSAHEPYYRELAPDELLLDTINVVMVAE